jgi:outer membrane protein assembly factor BamA
MPLRKSGPTPATNVKDQSVDIAFKFTSGPVVNIRRIDIAGNTKTRDVIRRELAVTEQRFSGAGFSAASATCAGSASSTRWS